MTQVAWRQFRSQAIVAAAALAATAAAVLVTGPALRHLFDTSVVGCAARGDCSTAVDTLQNKYNVLQGLLAVLLKVTPALIGIFWGAPLVAREIETGTYRLAWTQSVTRTRWLAAKLAAVGLFSVAATGLLTLAVAWWASPIDRAQANRFLSFDVRGVAPMGYAAAAFAIGVVAGVLIRHTLPAMATALAAYFGLRFSFTYWARPHLLPSTHAVLSLRAGAGGKIGFMQGPTGLTFVADGHVQNGLLVSSKIVDASGHVATQQALHAFLAQSCPQLLAQAAAPEGAFKGPPDPALFDNCLQALSSKYHMALTYLPHTRYWPLQWSEAAVFGALALGLCALSVWWVRRRLG